MRIDEWFVPRFGPFRFRVFVGMLFLPYTAICISFAIIGSMLPSIIYWDRVYAISIIYFLALGISAHILDAIGSRIKPWGEVFNKRHLLSIALAAVVIAYIIGLYYIIAYNLYMLAVIAVLEGFFLFAYNLELFNARFHNNFWFAISWGSLPLLAGYFIHTNQFSLLAIIASASAGLLSYAEIRISRRYKVMKKQRIDASRYERILKMMSITCIIIATFFVSARVL